MVDQKLSNFFSSCIFFKFWSSKPWIRISIQPKMLDPDPDSMKQDPKHCLIKKPWTNWWMKNRRLSRGNLRIHHCCRYRPDPDSTRSANSDPGRQRLAQRTEKRRKFSHFLFTVVIQYSTSVTGWQACCCASNLLRLHWKKFAPGFSQAGPREGCRAGIESEAVVQQPGALASSVYFLY